MDTGPFTTGSQFSQTSALPVLTPTSMAFTLTMLTYQPFSQYDLYFSMGIL